MGLYLKCPGCQAPIPIYEKACPRCGQSLQNLPREHRVYVIEPGGGAPAEASPAAAPRAAASPAKAARKPRAPKKKT